MSHRKEATPIQRGEGPSDGEESRLRGAIDRAKARGKNRILPPALEGTPRFDDLGGQQKGIQPAMGPIPDQLSEVTTKGLAALAQAQPQPDEEDSDPGNSGPGDNPAKEHLSPEEVARRAVESRVAPLDIGQFLMNGVLWQEVPIIDTETASLTVTFQTIEDAVEVFIDTKLSEEAAEIRSKRSSDGKKFVDIEMSQREYIRRQNEWALAAHIRSFQGKTWPKIMGQGQVDVGAMNLRLQNVREIPSHLFVLLSQNLGWFLDRVSEHLTAGVLGNG